MSQSRRLVVCWSRIIAAIVALTLLQACSAVKLTYNNVPDLAYWWIDGYADLNGAQSLKVREELARLQQWHRGAEMPRIAELLQKTQSLATADTTPEQVCGLFAEVRNRIEALVTQVEPATVALVMGVSAEQIAHIEAKFTKTNAEWRDDWISGSQAKRQAKRLKTARERSEQFYGALEERQIAVLRSAIARSDFDPQLSYVERLRRQQDQLQTLRLTSNVGGGSRLSVPQATVALRAYLARSVNSPDPAYRAWSDKSILYNCKTVAQLHNSTTAEQRERAVRRLAAYESDARELAAQQ